MTASMIQSAERDPLEIRVEAAGPDAAGGIGREERIGFEFACALEPLARGLRGDVEQRDRVSGVRQMCGDLRAHRAGAQYAGGSNFR